MPKKSVDYSNTIIYKICCKDETITGLYIGHTTNFIQRKYSHKIACNNLSNKLKIYTTIRSNGGWENWNMIEIARYNCKDSIEARIKEQEHYNQLKASLNSCPPYVDIKQYFCSTCELQCSGPKQYNKHINCLKHITKTKENISGVQFYENQQKNLPTTDSKFYCEKCQYYTNKKYNFNLHLQSIRHKNNATNNENNGLLTKTRKYECKRCKKIFNDRAGLWRHNKKCSNNSNDNKKLSDIDKDDIIITLLKQNAELIKGQQDIIVKLTENGIL
jgi:hypothetical protein